MVFVIVALFWLLQHSIVTLRRASSSPYQRLGSLIAQRIKSSFVRRSWHSLGSLKAAAPSLMQSEASACMEAREPGRTPQPGRKAVTLCHCRHLLLL